MREFLFAALGSRAQASHEATHRLSEWIGTRHIYSPIRWEWSASSRLRIVFPIREGFFDAFLAEVPQGSDRVDHREN